MLFSHLLYKGSQMCFKEPGLFGFVGGDSENSCYANWININTLDPRQKLEEHIPGGPLFTYRPTDYLPY